VQRWPETKRLLGLLVNSSGRAHGRNARRLVHAARNQDRRLSAALLAAGVAHTPEGEEVLRGARMRAARKPSGVARELLRNFPKSGGRRRRRRRKGASQDGSSEKNGAKAAAERTDEHELQEELDVEELDSPNGAGPEADEAEADEVEASEPADE
jgi:ribonuclease E